MARISAILFAVLVPLHANATEAERNGFTLELGIGPGPIQDFGAGDAHAELGVAFSFALGGFFDNTTALTVRWNVVQAYPDDPDRDLVVFVMMGPHVQNWIRERLFVGVGAGLAIYLAEGFFSGTPVGSFLGQDEVEMLGLGLCLRVGYSFASFEDHSLRATFELLPAYYGDLKTIAETITLEWQWY